MRIHKEVKFLDIVPDVWGGGILITDNSLMIELLQVPADGKLTKYIFSADTDLLDVIICINGAGREQIFFEGLEVEINIDVLKDDVVSVRIHNNDTTNKTVAVGLTFEGNEGEND